MKLALLLIVVLLPACFGHGWMVLPLPRGFVGDNEGSASQTAPCGKDGEYSAISFFDINGSIPVNWDLGGGHTGLKCRVAFSKLDTNTGSFENNVIMDNITCDNPGKDNVSVPLNGLKPGLYYIQWIWYAQGSTWYNCFKIAIKDPSIQLREITLGATEALAFVGTQYTGPTYLSLTVPTVTLKEKFLRIKVNTSSSAVSYANVTANSEVIPVDPSDGYMVRADPGTVKSINLCTLNTNIAYVTIFPNREYSLFEGSVEIKGALYDSHLDFIGVRERAFVLEAGARVFVWTAASSTLDVPKKVTIQGKGKGSAYIQGPLRNCDNNLELPQENKDCIDLPQNVDNNDNNKEYYFSLYVDGDWSGKASLEEGICSGASSFIISLFSLLLIVFVF
jgi:hypothetical protein